MTPAGPESKIKNPVLRRLWRTVVLYSSIDGEQRAASFAYYAFFALFPLLLLLVSIGSYFFDPAKVNGAVLNAVSQYVLVEQGKHDLVSQTIRGIIRSRRGAGVFAVLGLIWSSFRFFQALVRGVNRAWGTHEYTWWRLPIQNLLMVAILASALLVGVLAPAALGWVQQLFWHWKMPFVVILIDLIRLLFPALVLFYGLSMFYILAPRRKTTFREVWIAALGVTIALRILQYLFVLYATNVARFNAIYGAFGSVIAVLMWVYFSGSVIILGGCFCVIQARESGALQPPPDDSQDQ